MNKTKKSLFGITAFSLLMVKLAPLISAQWFWDIQRGPTDLMQIIRNFFGPIFESIIGVSQFDQYFFARVLFLILIYIMTSIALDSMEAFKGKKGINFIISAVVAILGARYIAEINVIQSMLLPYGAVTIAISIILPIILYGFFVHKTMANSIARRAAWAFFAVIFIGLWWTRRNDASLSEFRWIYNIGILVVLGVTLFDSKLHEYFGLIEAAEFKRATVRKQIADVEAELAKYANIPSPSPTTKRVIQHLEERREELASKL